MGGFTKRGNSDRDGHTMRGRRRENRRRQGGAGDAREGQRERGDSPLGASEAATPAGSLTRGFQPPDCETAHLLGPFVALGYESPSKPIHRIHQLELGRGQKETSLLRARRSNLPGSDMMTHFRTPPHQPGDCTGRQPRRVCAYRKDPAQAARGLWLSSFLKDVVSL